MSTQFRSRVKSVVNFGSDLMAIGTCCFTNGTSEELSFYECFIKNGTFIAGTNAECPNQGELVSCYACSYLTPSQKIAVINDSSILTNNNTIGVKQVTLCECTRIGGNISAQDPNNPGRDIRIPKACCYMDYDGAGFPIGITCENVCSEKECSLKGITFENGQLKNTPLFTSNSLCSEVECEPNAITSNNFAKIATGKESNSIFDIGTCYTLTRNDSGFSYSCEINMLHNCNGYWISSSYGENNTIFCGNSYAPQLPIVETARVIEPESMSEAAFDALNIQIGDSYKGGIYIGKYIPSSSLCKVYGSLNLQSPEEKYYDDSTPRDGNQTCALIVDINNINTNLLTTEEISSSVPQTSLSDGFYNTYGNKTDFFGLDFVTVNTIKGRIRTGFADYYIPSILELAFLANSIRNNSSLLDKLDITNSLSSSSIFFEDITSSKTNKFNFSNIIFSYGQIINSNAFEFGQMLLVPGTNKSDIRLFRKVILT
jgi:hypothetical protein